MNSGGFIKKVQGKKARGVDAPRAARKPSKTLMPFASSGKKTFPDNSS